MSDSWLVERRPELSGFTVEWAAPGDYILSRGRALYRSADLRPPFERIVALPLPASRRLAVRVRTLQRLLRLSFYNVLKLAGDRLFLTFDRTVAVLSPTGLSAVEGLDRPFRVLRGACAMTGEGAVWFGEYVRRAESSPLRVYRLAPGERQAEVAAEFPAGSARHIHGVYLDPYDQSIWCLTGDRGRECCIMRSVDGIAPFETIGSGDESWRAVSMQFRREAIFYASDAEFQANWLYRVERSTHARTRVVPLDGPVYYSHAVGTDLFFAVSAEGCPSQRDPKATLWHLDHAGTCNPVVSFAKDRYPIHFFQPGTLSFPRGPGIEGKSFFSGVALHAADNATFELGASPQRLAERSRSAPG